MSNTATLSPQEALSQSEIERLLAIVGDGDSQSANPGPNGPGTTSEHDLVARHEFPQLSSFTPPELRKLRVRHEEFIRALASRLSLYFRMECGLQMVTLETVRFQHFADSLSNPTHLSLFKLDPLPGICMLDVPPRLGMCIVDREMGGPGVCTDEARDLTKMEIRLLSRVVDLMINEWCGCWSDAQEIRPALLRHENSGRFLRTYSPDTMMLILGIETRLGDTVEQMQFCFPYFALEPLMLKLNTDDEDGNKPDVAVHNAPVRWNPVFDDVEVRVTAELNGVEVTAAQLADLKPGDVLRFSPEMMNQVRLCLETTPKFVGNLGKVGPRWAVEIAQTVKG